MKRFLVFGFFAIGAVLGCNDNSSEKARGDVSTTSPTTTNANADILRINREVTHAIEVGDTATLRKHIGSDGVDHGGGPNGADLKGEDLIRQLGSVHNDINNMKMEILQEATNGEYIFTLSRLTGTTNKPVWGMPGNFKIDSKSVDVVRVENMKMKDHWGYMDPAEMMKMMNSSNGSKTAKTNAK